MHPHRLATSLVGLLVTFVVVGSLVGASASGLGLTTSSIAGYSYKATPKVGTATIACDNFTGDGNLNGRLAQPSASCGRATWTVHLGTWETKSGAARSTGTTNAVATVAAGGLDRAAEVTVLGGGGGSNVAGLALAHNGSTSAPRYLVAVLVGSSSVQLRLVSGGTVTTVASASTTVTSSTRLRAVLKSGVVRVSVNGSLRITQTLTSSQLSTISVGSRYGIYDNKNLRFDDFLLTTSP